jgi:hypothetical protein
MSARLPVRRLLLLLQAVVVACSTAPRGPPRFDEGDYPGLLRPPDVLAVDVLWQQRVTATWKPDGRRGFDAALQKRGEELTLIGLSPMGTPGFVVVLRGQAISLRNETDRELPFPPRFMLLDVQRVSFPWLAADGAVRADGTYEGVVDEERVVETVRGGRLVERRFTRLDGRPQGTITVRYEWGQPDWLGPTRAVLENGWFGYGLAIDTLAETRLPPEDDAPGS